MNASFNGNHCRKAALPDRRVWSTVRGRARILGTGRQPGGSMPFVRCGQHGNQVKPPGECANQVEPCCWMTYTSHRDTQETLQTLERLDLDCERSDGDESSCVNIDLSGTDAGARSSPSAVTGAVASSSAAAGDDYKKSNNDNTDAVEQRPRPNVVVRWWEAFRRIRPIVWRSFEKPYSSQSAKVISMSLPMCVISIAHRYREYFT